MNTPGFRLDEIEPGILIGTLSRPARSNALDAATIDELEAAVSQIESDSSVRVLILTGAGDRVFSAGGDFAYFATLSSAESVRAMSERMQRLLHRLWIGRVVVIAAVNGAAMGGGSEILTACHLRLAADTARFRFVQAVRGVTPGWGGSARLVSLIGRARALDLLLTARTLDAAEASNVGLVTEVVPADRLIARATALARTVASHPPYAVDGLLGIVGAMDGAHVAAAYRTETEHFVACWMRARFWETCRASGDR